MSSSWPFFSPSPSMSSGMVLVGPSSMSEATFPLNSAYSYGSSGAAVGFIFCPASSGNLTDFWVRVKLYTGSWAATDGNINVEIREGLNGSNVPGTTVVGSFAITLPGSGPNTWVRATGLSIPLTAGKTYFAVVGDADGGATNFVTLSIRFGTIAANLGSVFGPGTYVTSNGYSSAATPGNGGIAFALQVTTAGTPPTSIVYSCCGFDTAVTTTNGTYERGIRFRPPEDCTIAGLVWSQDASNIYLGHTYKLYADAGTTVGGLLTSYTMPTVSTGGATAPTPLGVALPLSARYDLEGGTWYDFTVAPALGQTTPRKVSINGSSDAALLSSLMPLNGDCYWIDNSSGTWDFSQTTSMPTMGPILIPRSSSSGPVSTRRAY